MYIPLYVKSNYSMLSSMLSIDDVISFALENKLDAIAINDINMFGTMEFITKCNKNKIKPIISLSLKYEDQELVLFVKNNTGYHSLIKIYTLSSRKDITLDDLEKYRDGLLLVLPYEARNLYSSLNKIYDDIYLGYKNKEEEKNVYGITKNIVYFKEARYLDEEDSNYLKCLYMIRDGKTVLDNVDYQVKGLDLKIHSENVMEIGLKNTYNISNKCNFTLEYNKSLLPVYKDTMNLSADDFLLELTKKGLSKRLNGNVSLVYQNRLNYELKIIKEMGFSNYFLVVYDFIKYSKKNNILVGPGRGSAAGSLVSYSLGITDIDPIKYNLLFERFLNPYRKTMPDIDTDFPDDKRDQVISYVISKYGEKKVAGITTFGTLGIKQVIRDVSRILNIALYKVDSLSRYIPSMTKDTLEEFYQKTPSFKASIDMDKELTKMFNIAKRIEGFPRHTSIHAAGIVMCEYDLDDVIPLTYSDGMYLSCYPHEYLEQLGLLKMDFLGLKNLSMISNIINDIEVNRCKKISFSSIPLDDIETLKVFENADTCGIFQFESTGMRNFLKKLKPKTFEDIFAAIALFRPGPADNIDLYIRRKNNLEKITYLDPCLEPILNNTYGIIIYQEQIIEVASAYAGYTLGEADVLRRAMSKKKFDLLEKEEEKFIEKSVLKNHDRKTAKEIFSLILKFAGYGFNRSHSVAYSLIAYKMAYLKVHYKSEFFANLLSNVIGNEFKTKEYILEAKHSGIKIEKPNINLSDVRYVVCNDSIIYPFANIKKVGTIASSTIIKARENKKFDDIYDCFSRLYIAGISRSVFESLIFADCFSTFSYNKKTLYKNMDSLLNYAELTKDLDPSLVIKPEIEVCNDFSSDELLEQERETFGFYLTHHPTTKYLINDKNIIPLNEIKKYFNRQIDTIILVEKVKVINTKNGEKMSFVTGSDETTMVDYTLFPRIYAKYSNICRGDILKVRGNVERRLNDFQIIANKIDIIKCKED